jgi:hypothetical protein
MDYTAGFMEEERGAAEFAPETMLTFARQADATGRQGRRPACIPTRYRMSGFISGG